MLTDKAGNAIATVTPLAADRVWRYGLTIAYVP